MPAQCLLIAFLMASCTAPEAEPAIEGGTPEPVETIAAMGLNIKDPEAHRWAQSIAPINWRKHDPYRNPGLA